MDIDYLRSPFSSSFDDFTFVSSATRSRIVRVYSSPYELYAHVLTSVFSADVERMVAGKKDFVEKLARAIDVRPTESKLIVDNILQKLDHHGFHVHYNVLYDTTDVNDDED